MRAPENYYAHTTLSDGRFSIAPAFIVASLSEYLSHHLAILIKRNYPAPHQNSLFISSPFSL
jgi:hypothetical protein